jgi:hypothetical protein
MRFFKDSKKMRSSFTSHIFYMREDKGESNISFAIITSLPAQKTAGKLIESDEVMPQELAE